MRLTILCENSVARPYGLLGEHGFACYLEAPSGNYLFDTGQGQSLVPNARVLKKNLGDIRALMISHGHYDHTGGMPQVLEDNDGLDVYGHPDMFSVRYWEIEGMKRYLGIPYRRDYLETLGARFQLNTEMVEIGPQIWLTGEVPRRNSFETGDMHQVAVAPDGTLLRPDPVADDLSLVFKTAKGLVLVVGCAHAGMVNIMDYVAEHFPGEKLHAVIGGTHLSFAGSEQFEETIRAFNEAGIERIGVSHCTGLGRAAHLVDRLGERFFFANVGTVLDF